MTNPTTILTFWFSEEAKKHWWQSTPEFDAQLREEFAEPYAQAAAGELNDWLGDAESCLALILLLDQIPRNIFRGTAKAFATDGLARYATIHALEHGYDHQLADIDQKLFLYLPLEHSESLEDQRRCVDLMATHTNAFYTEFARKHLDIIARFGRFPHRNAALGRVNTPAETAFLAGPNSGF